MIWGAAGRNQHMPRSDSLAGSEPKGMWVLEHRAGLDDTCAGFFHIGCVGSLQSRDLLVLVGDQGRPVERRRRYGPAEAGGILDFVMDVGRIDQELFRNAAADHAGAAHPVFFGDQDPRAMAGGDPGGTYSTRTSPDDEQIDVELSHISPDRNQMPESYFLAAFAHLGAELGVDGFVKTQRPLIHIGHAGLN